MIAAPRSAPPAPVGHEPGWRRNDLIMNAPSWIRTAAASAAVLFWATLPLAAQHTFNLHTAPSGDANYSWNSKYGPWGYGAGGNSLDVGLSMGGTYGNDYTVGIFMVPISALTPGTLNSATLSVTLNGFSTGYYYGSATLGWLDLGSTALTGDVVADGLGPASTARPGGMLVYDSGGSPSGSPGVMTFDVLSYVNADLNAGRNYSTFVLSGSRDTYGSIMSAETGSGPSILVDSSIPEPASLALLAGALMLGAVAWQRRHAAP